ncbi:MAG: hypothetical protein J7D61_15405, partial [Marichromatium sp.]|nr:hypothetical protein [Marichromatium sp.]
AASRQPPAASRQRIEPQSREEREGKSDQLPAVSLQWAFFLPPSPQDIGHCRHHGRQPYPLATESWRLAAENLFSIFALFAPLRFISSRFISLAADRWRPVDAPRYP